MLGRPFVGGHQRAVGGLLEALHPEFAAADHDGERLLAQEILVESVEIVLPEMGGVPGVGYHVVLGIVGVAEDIILREAGPAFSLATATGVGGPLLMLQRHAVDIVQVRHVELGEIGVLGEPVVHLHVDI